VCVRARVCTCSLRACVCVCVCRGVEGEISTSLGKLVASEQGAGVKCVDVKAIN
jgi:hypothetical protein